MVEQAAADYAKILRSADLSREINPLCTNIEDMMARLDEFETLLENVCAESNGIMAQHVCGILSFSDNFQQLQKRIDDLEQFVGVVSAHVDQVERSVDIAEEELNVTDYSFKGLVLKPLLAKAKLSAATTEDPSVPRSNLKDDVYQPLEPTFKCDDYFGCADDVVPKLPPIDDALEFFD